MKKFGLIALVVTLGGCRQTKNIALAKNFYDQSLLESNHLNYKRSLQIINESLKLSENPESLAHKAFLLYQLEKFNEAIEIYKKLSKDKKIPSPLKTDVLNNYACSLIQLKRHEEASMVWRELTNDPNYLSPEVAWYNLGHLELIESKSSQEKNAHYKKALHHFAKAIEISREYTDAIFYLAITQIMLGELSEAKHTLIDLISSFPNHKAARNVLEHLTEDSEISF